MPPFNVALNYGYGFLEGEVRKAINSVGLEPSVGFLHDFSNYQTKQSLVYDLQEPFRWLVDLSVIQAFESETLELHNFYFTGDDYRYHFEPEAKQRFIDHVRARFNAGVSYRSRSMNWDTVIEQKTEELARFLTGRSPDVDFTEPTPAFDNNERELRTRILALTSAEANRLGIGKSTLHYLRHNARECRAFKMRQKTYERLSALRES